MCVSQGYGAGYRAPGRCSDRSTCNAGDSTREPYIVAHNILLTHLVTVDLYRTTYQVGSPAGLSGWGWGLGLGLELGLGIWGWVSGHLLTCERDQNGVASQPLWLQTDVRTRKRDGAITCLPSVRVSISLTADANTRNRVW